MKKFVIATVIIAMGLTAQAQISSYLAPGKSGLGIQVLGEQGPKFQGFGGSISGTFKGKIDVTLFGVSDVYGKAANDLITDEGKGIYYEAKATWWLFRNQITPGIDANFGLMAGFAAGSYKDFKYLNPDTGNPTEYNGPMGGMAGIQAAVNFQVSENWILQPSYLIYYNFNKNYQTEAGIETATSSNGVVSNIGISVIRRIGEGNAFVLTANSFLQSVDSGSFSNLTCGYIFSF